MLKKSVLDKASGKSIHQAKLRLKEEKMDIIKENIRICDIKVHKETFTEMREITVPINREELVINRVYTGAEGKSDIGNSSTIRIPLKEERIEIVKHPVVLEEVKVFSNQFKKVKTCEETLKKEQLHIEKTGHPVILDMDNQKLF